MKGEWYRGIAGESDLGEDERRQLKRFGLLCGHFAELELTVDGEVSFELPTHAGADPSLLSGPPADQGRRLARLERERLCLGADPLDDVEDILDAMGIKVIGLSMPASSEIAGGFFFDSEVGPCIMYNGSLSEEQKACALAHQYCHFLADVDPYLPRVCHWGESGAGGPSEERAGGFVGEFLLPAESLVPLMRGDKPVGTGSKDLKALGVHYGVPVRLVVERLRKMGFSLSPRGDLMDDAIARRRSPPAPDLPTRLVRLGLEARSRGLVSSLRMARLLQMDVATAEELFAYFVNSNEKGRG